MCRLPNSRPVLIGFTDAYVQKIMQRIRRYAIAGLPASSTLRDGVPPIPSKLIIEVARDRAMPNEVRGVLTGVSALYLESA